MIDLKLYEFRGFTLVVGRRVFVHLKVGDEFGPVLLDCATLEEAMLGLDLTRAGHPLESRALRTIPAAPLPLFPEGITP